MEYKSIFVIQVICGEKYGTPEFRETRTIGWQPTYDLAVESLVSNSEVCSDDGYYHSAIIEEVPQGLYSIGLTDKELKRSLFRYIDKKYVEVSNKELPDNVIGFTMG